MAAGIAPPSRKHLGLEAEAVLEREQTVGKPVGEAAERLVEKADRLQLRPAVDDAGTDEPVVGVADSAPHVDGRDVASRRTRRRHGAEAGDLVVGIDEHGPRAEERRVGVRTQGRDRRCEQARQNQIVGCGEQQELTRCRRVSGPHGGRYAAILGVPHRFDCRIDARHALDDGGAAVGGAVVDDNDLGLPVGLLGVRAQRVAQPMCVIVIDQNDGKRLHAGTLAQIS